MTTLLGLVAIVAVIFGPALIWVEWDLHRARRRYTNTRTGNMLADLLAAKYADGTRPVDGTGYVIWSRHPTGVMVPRRVLTGAEAEAELGDEVETFLTGRGGAR